MSPNTQLPAVHSRLEHFPISFFAVVMGVAGLAIALHKAGRFSPVLGTAGLVIAGLAGAVFLMILAVYALKIMRHPAAVVAEFHHPVRLHFIPASTIGLLLIGISFVDIVPDLSHALFLIAAPMHLVLTLMVLNQWINRDHFQVPHLNPAWFIPIVGNILVPILGVPLGYIEVSWMYFSIGIVFWLPIFALILNRVLFHNPIPERLAPTLFILIAPPAVGFLAYLRLTGALDGFARILYYFALFLTVVLATQVPRLSRLRFFLSWWAYSFPMAAITIASLTMAELTGKTGFLILGLGLLVLVVLIVGGLIIRTLAGLRSGEFCQPE